MQQVQLFLIPTHYTTYYNLPYNLTDSLHDVIPNIKIKYKERNKMFETERTVYRHKEGVFDLMDERNMNVVSGYCPFRNKTEKLNIWKQLKRQYGDNIRIKIEDQIIMYSCQIERNHAI